MEKTDYPFNLDRLNRPQHPVIVDGNIILFFVELDYQKKYVNPEPEEILVAGKMIGQGIKRGLLSFKIQVRLKDVYFEIV